MTEMMNEKLKIKQSNLFSLWPALKHTGPMTELSTSTLRAFIKCLCQEMEIQRGGKAWARPSGRTLLVICSLSKWHWGTRYLASRATRSCSPQAQTRTRKRWMNSKGRGWVTVVEVPPDSVIHPGTTRYFMSKVTTCDICTLWRQSKSV